MLYDLDTMSCVSKWNNSTQVQITDTQLRSIPLCRSLNYYLDPTSTSVVELGTIEHPYKEFESVLVELMNFHTHNNRVINLYIMEETISYWLQSNSYISNITMLNVQTYSNTRAVPSLANIVGVKVSEHRVSPGMATRFSILSKLSFLLSHPGL